MDLPQTIPIHPVDLLYGATLPQLQTYICAGPATEVDVGSLEDHLRELLPRRFTRMCYAQRNHLFAGRLLHRVDDIVEPLVPISMEDFRALSPAQMRDVGERHWRMYLIQSEELVVICFMVGHWLATGMKARWIICSALDHLYPDKPPGQAPEMSPRQWEAFRAYQDHMAQVHQAEDDFAEYRREFFTADRIRQLAHRLGTSFTDSVALWLARTIHDASDRERPLDIVQFRMERGLVPVELNDPGYTNEGLIIELREMLPDGFYALIDPASGLGSQKAREFEEFYRRFPAKGALFALLDWSIRRQKRKHMTVDRERLVMNNLGPGDYPFFRTIFFDPFNDQDSFGLVFVDTCRGETSLQFAPPKRYLAHFDWDDFSRKLDENLTSMLDDPRIETRDEGG